nr:uncharacterized protein LOC128702171 [Cherax quadricarinatus]
MNWVGGVRRRVLLREEERRRQEQFFAAHVSSARHRNRISQGSSSIKPGYVSYLAESSEKLQPAGTMPLRPRTGSQRWRNEEMVCKRIKQGSASLNYKVEKQCNVKISNAAASSECEGKKVPSLLADNVHHGSNTLSGNSRARRIKPTSIHGPFSKFLLKLEMEGIEKKSQQQDLLRSSEGRQPEISGNRRLFEESESERERRETGNHEGNDEEMKIRNIDTVVKSNINYKSENILRDRNKDGKNTKSENGKLGEKGFKNKEKEATEIHSKNKKSEIKVELTDVNKKSNFIHRTKTDKTENRKNNYGIQQNYCISKSKKHKYNLKETEDKEKIREDTFRENKVEKELHAKYETQKIKSHKNTKNRVTDKTKVDKRQNLLDKEIIQKNCTAKKMTEELGNKEHLRHTRNKSTETCGDLNLKLMDLRSKQTNLDLSETNNSKLDKKDEMKGEERNFYLRERSAQMKKGKQKNKDSKSDALQMSSRNPVCGKNKNKVVSSIPVPSLLIGAPRVRQMLSLSPKRHKGRIWAPLNLPQEPFLGKDNGNNDGCDSEEKYKHQKCRCMKDCGSTGSKENSEWEERRLEMLLGPRLHNSPGVCSIPCDIQRNSDQIKNLDAFEQSHSRDVMPLLRASSVENDEHLKPKEASNGSKMFENSLPLDVRRLGKRKLQIIYKNIDKIQEEISQKVLQNKPKLSSFTRKIEKVEGGLSFARQRKDKTPYMDKGFSTPWNLSKLFNTSNSSKSSSKTPSDPTLERSQEDPFGSQGGSELCNATADHTTQVLLNFDNREEPEENSKSRAREISSYFSLNQVSTEKTRLSSTHREDEMENVITSCVSKKDNSSSVDLDKSPDIDDCAFYHTSKKNKFPSDQLNDKMPDCAKSESQALMCGTQVHCFKSFPVNSPQSCFQPLSRPKHHISCNNDYYPQAVAYDGHVFQTDRELPYISGEETNLQGVFLKDVNPSHTLNRDTVSSQNFSNLINASQSHVRKNVVLHSQAETCSLWSSSNDHAFSNSCKNEILKTETSSNNFFTSYNLNNEARVPVRERSFLLAPWYETDSLQASDIHLANRSTGMQCETNSTQFTSQLNSSEGTMQDTYKKQGYSHLLATVQQTPSVNITSTVSHNVVNLMPEGKCNLVSKWMDTAQEREPDSSQITFKKDICSSASQNILYSDVTGNNIEPHDYCQNVKQMRYSNELEGSVIHNETVMNYDNSSTREVVGDGDHLQTEQEYKKQKYAFINSEDVFRNRFMKENFDSSLFVREENGQNPSELHDLKISENNICIEKLGHDSERISSSFKDNTKHSINTAVDKAKLQELHSAYFLGNNTHKLISEEGAAQFLGSGKDWGEVRSRILNTHADKESKLPTAAKVKGDNIIQITNNKLNKISGECSQDNTRQVENFTSDMTLKNFKQNTGKESNRQSSTTSRDVRSTLEELFTRNELEEYQSDHQDIDLELAAQQFKEVIHLRDDDLQEVSLIGTPHTS